MAFKTKIARVVKVLLLVLLFTLVGCTDDQTNGKTIKAVNNLIGKMPTVVETDFEWPTLDAEYTGAFEAKFVSTNTSVISDQGEVNRGIDDIDVVIKVGVIDRSNNAFYSKDVRVKVLALTEDMVFDLIELELDTIIPANTDKNIHLPTFDKYQAEVVYLSENPDLLTNAGVITRSNEDVLVTLNAIVTFRDVARTFKYQITILKYDDNNGEQPIEGTIKLHVIDVGQGDAMVIELPNGQILMIDAGKGLYGGQDSDKTIKNYLDGLGVKTIDYLVISHPHSDHYEWVPMLLQNYTVKNYYTTPKTRTNTQYLNIMQAIKNAGLTVQIPKPGDYIFDFEDLSLLTIASKAVSDENASSLMVKLTYKNNTFMFTGDGGFGGDEAENRALASGLNLRSDVLKVGHHGSGGSSSNEFLAAVGAKYGIITTAPNSGTGHPHETAMARLKNAKVDIYQTKDLGHIIVIGDGQNYQFNSIKNGVLTKNVAPSNPWRS